MKIIVTGGAGYIGSHICKALAESGFQPVVVDSLICGNESAVRWGPLEKIDIRDSVALKNILLHHTPAAVIHCAGLSLVGESVQKPLLYYETNVGGTLALLKALSETKPLPLIISSTCAIYGEPQALPLKEDHPKAPLNPYGHTKLVMERMIKDSGMPFAFLRYFNAAGSAGEIGEDHNPETHLVPLAVGAALHQYPLKIFGTDYPTADGTAIRDYVHVLDLAEAHLLSLKKLLSGSSSFEANLGTGKGVSVKEVIQAVEKVTGFSVPLELHPRREGDATELVADVSFVEDLLGWKARHPHIEEIVRTAYEWQRKKQSF